MSKKKKKNKDEVLENYYDLKVDKVDELVAALKGDDLDDLPPVSMNISDCTGVDDPKNVKRNGEQKQFDPYKRDFLSRIPVWVKAIFIKWWFFGVICYFVNMGLGIYVTDSLDMLVLTGIITGLAVELFVNPIFRYMECEDEYKPYIMFPFPFKAFWTFFANILYYSLVIYGTSWIYTLINEALRLANPESYFAIEPLVFGIFTLIVDMALIGIKDLIVFSVKKLRKKRVTTENV